MQNIQIEYPCVIKPINEGSSYGVRILYDENDKHTFFDADDWCYGNKILVEKYVPGKELTVAIMDDRPLGVTEIIYDSKVYDFQAKYKKEFSKHFTPAEIPKEKYEEAMKIGLNAHQSLGCRGITRADLRYDFSQNSGEMYLMELNTQPGLTPISLFPEIAKYRDISFDEIIKWLVKDAGCNK